ncbi:MAG: hypothetical protein ACI835_001863 [Planctomycetota bacterium]
MSERVRTDAEGRFRAASIQAGETTMQILVPGKATLWERVVVGPVGQTKRRFVLDPEARVKGVVYDEEGEPIYRSRVNTEPKWRFRSVSTFSDEMGRYEIGGLGEDDALSIGSEHYLACVASGLVSTQFGETAKLDLHSSVPPRLLGRLLGVSDPDILASIQIHMMKPDGTYGVIEVDGATYKASALAPGTYSVRVTGDFVASLQDSVKAEPGKETILDMTLERAGLRVLHVTARAGAAIPLWMGYQVVNASGQFAWSGAANKLNGESFEVRVSVPPGSHVAQLSDNMKREVGFEVAGLQGGQSAVEVVIE